MVNPRPFSLTWKGRGRRDYVGPKRQIKLWTKPYQKPARCLACLISMMSGSSGQTCFPTGYFKSFTHYIQPLVSKMVTPAARPCGSKGWTLNFFMRDQVQVMSLQGKRLRAFQDRWRVHRTAVARKQRLFCLVYRLQRSVAVANGRVAFKVTDTCLWGGVTSSRYHYMKSDSTVRCCFTTACYCTSIYVVLVAVALRFGFVHQTVWVQVN